MRLPIHLATFLRVALTKKESKDLLKEEWQRVNQSARNSEALWLGPFSSQTQVTHGSLLRQDVPILPFG